MSDTRRKSETQKSVEEDLSLGEPGAMGGQGRGGGRLARQVGTKDELKRAFERPAGKTRVTKADEKE